MVFILKIFFGTLKDIGWECLVNKIVILNLDSDKSGSQARKYTLMNKMYIISIFSSSVEYYIKIRSVPLHQYLKKYKIIIIPAALIKMRTSE